VDQSSYLRYLPPVLWRDVPPDQGPPVGVRLGEWLRIVEKLLTGIDDGVTLPHGDHTHPAITDVIAATDRLFDPWKTPADMLPWLASWVALELPTLRGQPLWDEYQRRRVTAGIAATYRRRGLKAGLLAHLGLHALGPARPRVAVDDGSRVLVTRPRPDAVAPVSCLVSQGPVLRGQTVVTEGLIRPWCIARSSAGEFFVGDSGLPSAVALPLRSRVWQLTASGEYRFAGAPPKPRPVAPATQLNPVIAVAVRPATGGQPETLYVLDRRGTLLSVPAPFDADTAGTVTSLVVGANLFTPIAMAVDVNGDLLVLDRGDGAGTPNPPKIVTVAVSPLNVTRRNLSTVLEPLSLLVRPDGSLVIGDGREQEDAGPGQLSGNLVLVDRSNPGSWAESLLLPAGSPLVAPTGITQARDGTLHVLDVGLKPFRLSGDPFVRAVCEPAAVYRVDPDTPEPAAVRVSEAGHMVFPTGMVADGDRLVICDPGQPESAGITPIWPRLRPFRFDVVVHFLAAGLPDDQSAREQIENQVIATVRSVVEDNRPAHTEWGRITAV
jgi:phage tail-like protein